MQEIRFGTDGWRGVIARDFTFENVRLVGQAICDWVKNDIQSSGKQKAVAVGFDTRFLSDAFAQEVSCVLAANDIRVILSQRSIPTPIVSFTVKNRKLDAGIMITASHNPAQFNGLKIKTADGGAAPKSVTEKVEQYLGRTAVEIADFERARQDGRIIVADLSKEYVSFIRKYLDFKRFKKARFRVLLDAMYGSGNGYAAQILKGTGIKLELMRSGINPSFEGKHPEPTEENIPLLLQRMKQEKFDLGLVLDGDADRIAAVMPGGEFISPQKILGLLALHLFQDRGMRGGVVKTMPGTVLVDRICKDLSLPLYETPVGFKYISELMTSKDILVGGEEAGGMGFKNYIPERDGTLAGLLLLEMMIYRRKNIGAIVREMEEKYGRFYYLRADLKTRGQPVDLAAIKQAKELLGKRISGVNDSDGIKLVCADDSWLMFRASGTEPLVRVYAEAGSFRRARSLIAFGEKFVKGQ